MSHYETAEQRRIRNLNNKINAQTKELERARRENKRREREAALAKERAQLENQRLQSRLNQMQNDLRVEQSNRQEIQQLQAQLNEKDRILQSRMETMRQNYQATIKEITSANAKQRKNLETQITSTRKELNQQISNVRLEAEQKIQDSTRALNQRIQQVRQETQQQIRAIDVKISHLEQAQTNQKELAQFWLSEAQRYYNQLTQTFHAQLFDVKTLEQLRRRIQNTEEDISNSSYQSAITGGREAVYDAMDLREELVQRELEWNTLYNQITQRQTELLEQLNSADNRVYEFEAGGKTRSDDRGIDYWSYGLYQEIKDEANSVLSQLEESRLQATSLDDMRALESKLRDLQENVIRAEQAARTNLSMSLDRARIAQAAGETLREDFAMSEAYGTYFAREQREEYHALYKNPVTGKEAVLTITPVINPLTHIADNHIDVLVRNANNDLIAANELTTRVAEALQQSGVEGCRFPCSNRAGTDEEMNRVGAIQDVRQGKVESRTKIPQQHTENKKPEVRIK